jgi:hypothetical protein
LTLTSTVIFIAIGILTGSVIALQQIQLFRYLQLEQTVLKLELVLVLVLTFMVSMKLA